MKLLLNQRRQQSGFLTLGGLIIGIMLLIVGCLVVFLLCRLARIAPRELPDEQGERMEEEYPGYNTNYNARLWPVHFVPAALDLVTAEPNAPIYEKVILENHFLVQACMDGTLTNWVTQFHWIIGGSLSGFADGAEASMADVDGEGYPWVRGFESHETGGVSYRMKEDYSGFDIQVSPELMATQKCMFWRTYPGAD